jgi:methylated-DNA-[protein]-cysteine S-methyltransferase
MPAAKTPHCPPLTLYVFPTDLGWMALVTAGDTVRQLTFGHPSAAAARKALGPGTLRDATPGRRGAALVRRLQAYASGKPEDFHDVPIDPGSVSDFRRRILNACRKIPVGKTLSYAELAAKAGSARAARAIGNCMAGNRIPLIVPCHRVVCSDGRLGSYSAPGGTGTKRRLLAMESGNWPRIK